MKIGITHRWRLTNLFFQGCLAVLLLSRVAVVQAVAPQLEGQGEVNKVMLASRQIVLGGRTYQTHVALRVEIAGSYGALSMLQQGMQVYFRFVQHEDGRREVLEIRQLASNQPLEQS